jgi:hypothetical protein
LQHLLQVVRKGIRIHMGMGVKEGWEGLDIAHGIFLLLHLAL